jgi:hypothetical protein
MKSNNHLKSPKLLILSEMVQEYINMPNFIIISQDDKNKLYNLKNVASGIIAEWATSIRNGVQYPINEYAKKSGKSQTGFRFHLPDIIETAYLNELTNVENIISFIKNLPYIEHYSIGYSALFEKMKSNDHLNSYQLLMLAFRVKESMQFPNYHKLEQNYKDKFEHIKQSLASNVINFVWGSRSKCTLINAYFGEYLYSSGGWYSYRVYTWIPGTIDDSLYWKIEGSDMSNAYFNIKNIENHRFLDGMQDSYDGNENRKVFTSRNPSSAQPRWRIIPDDGYFLLKSKSYLYADRRMDASRRYVYIWESNNVPDSVKLQNRWHIIC